MKINNLVFYVFLVISTYSFALITGWSASQPNENTLLISIYDWHEFKNVPEEAQKHAKQMEGLLQLLKETNIPVIFNIELKPVTLEKIKKEGVKRFSPTISVAFKHAVDANMQEENITYKSFDIRDEHDAYVSNMITYPSYEFEPDYIKQYLNNKLIPKYQKVLSNIDAMPISENAKHEIKEKFNVVHQVTVDSLKKIDVNKTKSTQCLTFTEKSLVRIGISQLSNVNLATTVLHDLKASDTKIIVSQGGLNHITILQKVLELNNTPTIAQEGTPKHVEYMWKNIKYPPHIDKRVENTLPKLSAIIENFKKRNG